MSMAIAPSGGGSDSNAFAQQGTVDWTMLSRSTMNFTVEILSRLSKAGVEPITAAMGQAIFAGFNLDPDGQKRFSDVVSRLKAFSSYGDIMWFGFGVKHIVRTLSETEQGATCAAICACLSVSYDKFFCSKVLKALADQQKAPNSLMPSISQWAALANICSGAVLGSRFPQLVEVYSRLTRSHHYGNRHGLQETTSADSLASALLELAKVSSGIVRSITFTGGVDCGWLAALAQWLLSLRVDIITADGLVIYSSRTSADTTYYPQVSIVQQLGLGSQSNTTLIKQSMFVKPGRLFFGKAKDVIDSQGHFFSAGRSKWSTILRNAFGTNLDALLHPEVIQDFADLLCCGFSISDTNNGQLHFDPWRGLSTTNTEMQLRQLAYAANRLPELMPVCLIAIEKLTEQEIRYGIRNSFPRVFTRHCSCDQCKFHIEYNLAAKSGNFPLTQTKICLEKAALAIFEYAWTLSWLDIDENIYPSVRGLLLMYNCRVTDAFGDKIEIAAIKDRVFRQPLISIAIELFSGHPGISRSLGGGLSAASASGVCAYLPSLQDPTTSPQEQLRVIVVTGHIEWDSKIFSQAKDGKRERDDDESLGGIASSFIDGYGSSNVTLKLLVEETFTSDVLVADIWISSKPIEPFQCIPYHDGHVGHPLAASSASRPKLLFGASRIRSAILRSRLTFSCLSKSVEMQAISVNGPLSWSGHCSEAAGYLWVDENNNQTNCPAVHEWVLISRGECCQEIIRGPYQLLYSVICRLNGKSTVRLSSVACLVCLLGTHQKEPAIDQFSVIVGYRYANCRGSRRQYSTICDLERVTVHSFLSSGPSSHVLLDSAKFLPETEETTQSPAEPDHEVSPVVRESNSDVLSSRPMLPSTPQTAEPPSGPDHTISSDNKLSDSSVILSQAAPTPTSPTTQPPSELGHTIPSDNQLSDLSVLPSQATSPPPSRPAQPPSELGHKTPDVDQQESDSSAIPSQAIQGGIPHRGRDFKSSNPSEIRRARSL